MSVTVGDDYFGDPPGLARFSFGATTMQESADAWYTAVGRSISELDLGDFAAGITLKCDQVSNDMNEVARLSRRVAEDLVAVTGTGFDVDECLADLAEASRNDGLGPGGRDELNDYIEQFGDVPTIGMHNVEIEEGSSVAEFQVPVWKGHGVTRIQYFIAGSESCLPLGDDIPLITGCYAADGRGFAEGTDRTNYNVPSRVRVIIDHETGKGLIVASPTHDLAGGRFDALPVTIKQMDEYRINTAHPSNTNEVHLYAGGPGIGVGAIALDYRFMNSATPGPFRSIGPAITGAFQIQKGPHQTVEINGMLADYPSIEIIRDLPRPNGYQSTTIYTQSQADGPLELYNPKDPFEAIG